MDDRFQDRLDRIEEKIDKLSDVMISLARVEEKILSVELNNNAAHQRLERHNDRLDRIHGITNKNENAINDLKKIMYIVQTFFAGGLIAAFFDLI